MSGMRVNDARTHTPRISIEDGDKGRRGPGTVRAEGSVCGGRASGNGGGLWSLAVLVLGDEDLSEWDTGRRLNAFIARGGLGSGAENPQKRK